MLIFFWKEYTEIRLKDFLKPFDTIISIFGGIAVFILWVNMDWDFATFGTLRGYDPTIFKENIIKTFLIISRLAGAVIVVPFMEELFWRAFHMRYVVNNDGSFSY